MGQKEGGSSRLSQGERWFVDEKNLLVELEALAERLGITVRYEPLKIEGAQHTGGFCRVKGQDFVIIHKKASTRDKIHVLTETLRKRDLSQLYLLPTVRKALGDDEDVRPTG